MLSTYINILINRDSAQFLYTYPSKVIKNIIHAKYIPANFVSVLRRYIYIYIPYKLYIYTILNAY